MHKEDAQYVQQTIESEGFDYAFRDYSDFKNISDPTFHQLREAYLNAAKKLEDYIKKEAI